MKKLIFILLFGVLAGGVCAQESVSNFQVGVKVGSIAYDEDILDSSLAYGVQGSWQFQENWRLKVSYDMFEGDENSINEFDQDYGLKTEVSVDTLYTQIEYLIPYDSVKWFIGAGIGYAMMDVDVKNPSPEIFTVSADIDDALVYGLSGGLDYSLTDNFSVEVELSYYFGEADSSLTALSYGYGESEKEDVSLDHFSFFLSAYYKI